MATPNYAYEKRQRELAKKRKKQEKAQRKTYGPGEVDPDAHPGDGQASPEAGGDTPAAGASSQG